MYKDKNFDEILRLLFGIEGGYVNDPDDRGGPTNYGITQNTMDAWRKMNNQPKGTVEKDLNKKEARDIYYNMFWKESGADKYEDPREAMILFDMAVNSGPQEAKRIFSKSGENFYNMLDERKKYYDNIIEKYPEQSKYREGWYNRLNILENNANKMIESGFYQPSYYKEKTPFDEGYNGNLKPVENIDNMQEKRNKYQYHRNKSIEQGYIKPELVENKPISAPLPYEEWLKRLKRKRMGLL